jgi:threonine synthase
VKTPTTPAPSRLGYASHLTCRECGATSELGSGHACSECFGPLEVGYDLPPLTREAIEAGPPSIWRYGSLLPVPQTVTAGPNTEPGWTRLIRADNLASELGMRALWLKDERGNPTHSFKDRVVAVALAAAIELGYKVLACPSTGNLANAVAAAAARAGIRSVVLIPADLEVQKIIGSAVYGGTLVAVRGSYDDVNRLASELADDRPDWAFVNVNVRPYYAEGSKTIGFEIAEQLGWRLPSQIVVPVASGAQLVKIDKAFRELVALGLVPDTGYRVFGAQAAGCAPVAAAFRAGHDVVQPVRPSTVAKSLAIGNPADGPYVLDVTRRTGGAVADVSDEEIVDGMRLLARTEGVFGETAAGVTLGVLRRLLAEGTLDPGADTVIINSGDGLKTLDAVAGTADGLTAIPPTLDAFEELEASLPGSDSE